MSTVYKFIDPITSEMVQHDKEIMKMLANSHKILLGNKEYTRLMNALNEEE